MSELNQLLLSNRTGWQPGVRIASWTTTTFSARWESEPLGPWLGHTMSEGPTNA